MMPQVTGIVTSIPMKIAVKGMPRAYLLLLKNMDGQGKGSGR